MAKMKKRKSQTKTCIITDANLQGYWPFPELSCEDGIGLNPGVTISAYLIGEEDLGHPPKGYICLQSDVADGATLTLRLNGNCPLQGIPGLLTDCDLMTVYGALSYSPKNAVNFILNKEGRLEVSRHTDIDGTTLLKLEFSCRGFWWSADFPIKVLTSVFEVTAQA